MRKILGNKAIGPFFLAAVLLAPAPGAMAASGVVYDSEKRRDPFVPLAGEERTLVKTTSSGIKLEGIIYDPGGRSMAILNGKSYQRGEAAGNAMVVKILKDHVVISIEGEEKTLWIRDEEKA